MSKDNLDNLFNRLEHDFDLETPETNHTQRFLDKLNNKAEPKLTINKRSRQLWKPFMGIAASIALLVSIFIVTQQQPETRDLASVSPKMAQTEDFFIVSINDELNKLQEVSSPETKKIIEDALDRIKNLEKDYENLKYDLNESGNDNQVIYAMISNFQNRIDILQNTLEQINIIKQLKNQSNENSTTI
ncbi:hypothetical protein [Thalassobellus sediminis]|uniref:hypothetical protein n=1 Tax=Thalassobellus sediminis TaxID=3367753 RepID=UPI0037B3F511